MLDLDQNNRWQTGPVTATQTESTIGLLNVIWIHGANQSAHSFAYLRQTLPNWSSTLIDYQSQNGFRENLKQMVTLLDRDRPSIVIGHSMGGIYALHLAQMANIIAGISIATPFGGSVAAQWGRVLFPRHRLFRDVASNSTVINETSKLKINIPWLQIVSTAGNVPYLESNNDGVVTIRSMQARDDVQYVSLPFTHYEIICNEYTANIIKDCYQQAQKLI